MKHCSCSIWHTPSCPTVSSSEGSLSFPSDGLSLFLRGLMVCSAHGTWFSRRHLPSIKPANVEIWTQNPWMCGERNEICKSLALKFCAKRLGPAPKALGSKRDCNMECPSSMELSTEGKDTSFEFRSAETRSDSDSSRFRLSVLGFRLSVSAFGFRFPAFGFRPPFSDCFRFWFSAFGFRCSAFGFRLSVSGFRLSPSGFVSLSAFGFRIGGQRGWNSVHASHMSKPVM